MIFVNKEQKETLMFIDDMIGQGKTHDEIIKELDKKGYAFRKNIKNGYMSRTETELLFDNKYCFVDLIKRKNGLATYNYIKIS